MTRVWRFVVIRLGRGLLTVLSVALLVFLLVRLVPGDPVDAILGDQAAPEDREAMRRALGLDRPLGEQLASQTRALLDGSLGHSFRRPDRTVGSLIAEAMPHTVALALAALAVAWAVALPLGVLAAASRGRRIDRIVSGLGALGAAVPTIVLGPLLVLVFGVVLQWLPMPGDEEARGVRGLLLPALATGGAMAATLLRQCRAATLEAIGEPWVAAARARGLSGTHALVRHALPTALGPVLTLGAAQAGALLSGAVVAERLFERPGLGSLLVEAFFDRDVPVVQGCALLAAALHVGIFVVADLLHAAVDPRVREAVSP
ncbi:MAG: ABC transporter permease [Myxococcota bacterium]|nr:ABC transporter permease [Myxococcota bacterium]MDW8362615.1 ABC transporter permease [Myxococcales bacterium]